LLVNEKVSSHNPIPTTALQPSGNPQIPNPYSEDDIPNDSDFEKRDTSEEERECDSTTVKNIENVHRCKTYLQGTLIKQRTPLIEVQIQTQTKTQQNKKIKEFENGKILKSKQILF